MYIILGGTGHLGAATAEALLAQGASVTLVTRSANKAGTWLGKGAQLAECDVREVSALRSVFKKGRRLLLLNPPADPAGDVDREERSTIKAILDAVNGSNLERVVAISTYGARPDPKSADLGSLFELEQGLAAQSIPTTVLRAAYLMSNWDMQMESARKEGVVRSMLPAGLSLPMVAPKDMGVTAARFLSAPEQEVGTFHVEGPARYSPTEVASAMAIALGRNVGLEIIPRSEWVNTFKQFGFSPGAAESYAHMTGLTVDGLDLPNDSIRGQVTLQEYVAGIV